MGRLDDIYAADAAAICSEDEQGELIVYCPIGEAEHPIWAIVRRNVLKDAGGGLGQVETIEIDLPIGPSPNGRPKINAGGVEFVMMKKRVGDADVKKLAVTGLLGQSGGKWKLLIG